MLTCPAYTGRRSRRRFFGAKEELNLENVRGEKRRLLFPSRVSLTRSVTIRLVTTTYYTTLYGENSVKYLVAITWKKISDTIRSLSTLPAFEKAVRQLRF